VEKRKQRLLEEQRLLKKIRKTPRELEQEKRVEGLQTSLDVSNKVKNYHSLMHGNYFMPCRTWFLECFVSMFHHNLELFRLL
jgi:hypothetical protein